MVKDINLTLGKRVNFLRKNLKITREKLAETIDVSPRFLADVESGKVGVSMKTLKNLCLALSTSADYLLGFCDNTTDNYAQQISSKLSAIDLKYYPLILAVVNELCLLR